MAEITPTVFVVDDDEAVRESLSVLLRTEGYCVETFSSADAFLARSHGFVSGCVIADIHMPGISGLELQAEFTRRRIGLPFIIITGQGDVPKAVTALKGGAIDFLEKPCNVDTLLRVVSDALDREGRRQCAEDTARKIESRQSQLSPREQEVMNLMVKGHPNKAIGTRLGISTRTVENHRAKVMEKMECDNLPKLIHLALHLNAQELV